MPKDKEKEERYRSRSWLMMGLSCTLFLLFTVRLFYLQVLSPEYKQKANANAFYRKAVYPERGAIFDRKGSLLVYNEPAYDIMVTTKEVQPFDTLALGQMLGIDEAKIRERFLFVRDRERNPGYSPYVPQLLLPQLNLREAGRFQEQLFRFPGFSVRRRSVRKYRFPNAALILGYMSECNQRELSTDSMLAAGDYVGKNGVEKTYELPLRGKKGYEILLRDAVGKIQGKYKQGLEDLPDEAGKNVHLSIDIELQAFGEALMKGKRGAVVAIEPQTGEILALVSSPSFDPAMLSGKELGDNFRFLQTQSDKPLFNRAIMGTYPPGSTFKPTQAAALLHKGVLTPSTYYSCHGGYPLLRGKPGCHPHASPLNVTAALATSCNAFFSWGLHYFIDDRKRSPSVQKAFDEWKDEMVSMGYGYRLDVDLPGEKRGYIPNSSVYDKIYKKRWSSSTVISIAIGQGEITATPLQMANFAAITANRGHYFKPHVVREIQDLPLDSLYTHRRETGISPKDWEIVVEGMARAVTGGTCHMANFAPGEIEVCGKTGTAENPHGKDHSAFIGFAPRHNPQIAIAVYVENGGFGAIFGVPIGRLMMEYYLRGGVLSPYSEEIATGMQGKKVVYFNAF